MAANVSDEYRYWDFMDGDAMVCSSHGPPEYRAMCIFNQYVLGAILTADGFWFLNSARRLGRLLPAIGQLQSAVVGQPPRGGRRMTRQQVVARTTNLSHLKHLTFVLGIEYVCVGVALLIGGSGTVYPTTSLAGLASDLAFGLAVAVSWIATLVQLRGAKQLRNVIRTMTIDNARLCTNTRLAYILDVAFGASSFVFAGSLWLLLASAWLNRSAYYAAMALGILFNGLFSVGQNVLSRIRTLRRVDVLQQAAGGELEVRLRRRNILQGKLRTLLLHTTIIMLTLLFAPLSLIVFGSVNSSTQMLIHNGVNHVLFAISMTLVSSLTHKQVSKSWRRHSVAMPTSVTDRSSGGIRMGDNNADNNTVANESGLSVVEPSECATGARQTTHGTHRGLFSEIEDEGAGCSSNSS
jgi:hypothetical protein